MKIRKQKFIKTKETKNHMQKNKKFKIHNYRLQEKQ